VFIPKNLLLNKIILIRLYTDKKDFAAHYIRFSKRKFIVLHQIVLFTLKQKTQKFMKKVLLLLAVLFSFSAMTFAKTLPASKNPVNGDLKAKVMTALAAKDKSLAANQALVNMVAQDLQKEVKKLNATGDQKVNLKKNYNVNGEDICIDITIDITVTVGDDYIEIDIEITIDVYEC
jgi:hypothetical protein